ncbi:MAG: hypothetical protein GWP14_01260 [Actinobacteria bacterium]|nr:hypothetical protein [Actinomycetota bacterium]
MMDTAQEATATGSNSTVEQCVQRAHSEGIGEFQPDRRSTPRLPFVHPIRYCLGSSVTKDDTQPGYILDISLDGMGMFCRQGLPEGQQIWVRLPLSDGRLVWLNGTIIYCEPDVEHYRVAIAFAR